MLPSLGDAFIDFYWPDVEALFTVIGMFLRKGNWNALEKVPGTLLICNLGQLHVNWLIVEVQIWRPHDDQCCPTNAKDGENPEEKSIEHHGDKLPVFFHLKEKKEIFVNMMTLPVSWEPYL